MMRCTIWMVSSLAGTSASSATTTSADASPAVHVRVADGGRDEQGRAEARSCRDSPASHSGRTTAGRAADRSGTQATLRFELPPAAANQVVADVRAARVRRLLGNLPRAFDALQRDAHLAFAGRIGQLLDRVAIAIAAAEIHPAVDAGRVALQHLLDQADALEELAPVERRRSAAGCRSGSPSIACSTAWCCPSARMASSTVSPLRDKRRVELLPQRRGRRAVFPASAAAAG